MLDKVFSFEIEDAIRSQNVYESFLSSTEDLRKFINSHQYIQGFQISTTEFYQGDTKVLQNLEEYINLLAEKKEVKIFRQSSKVYDLEKDSKNVEVIEGRTSQLKKKIDFDQFDENNLIIVEPEEEDLEPFTKV